MTDTPSAHSREGGNPEASGEAPELREFPTLLLGSFLTDIMLRDTSIAEIHELAGWAAGHAVWTHELVHEPVIAPVRHALREAFPLMPDREAAQADWRAAAAAAIAAYGETVQIPRGTMARDAGPVETLNRVMATRFPHLEGETTTARDALARAHALAVEHRRWCADKWQETGNPGYTRADDEARRLAATLAEMQDDAADTADGAAAEAAGLLLAALDQAEAHQHWCGEMHRTSHNKAYLQAEAAAARLVAGIRDLAADLDATPIPALNDMDEDE